MVAALPFGGGGEDGVEVEGGVLPPEGGDGAAPPEGGDGPPEGGDGVPEGGDGVPPATVTASFMP